jgi:asparagine synthase (glutamine-hydrolysing)
MQFSERYRSLPAALRRTLERVVSLIPAPLNFRTRLVRLQRFLRAASLPRSERYFRWTTVFDDPGKSALYSPEFKARINGASAIDHLSSRLDAATSIGIIDSVLLTDLMNYLPNDLLVKIDIASMANSLEARSPFLDHKVIEFAASLPEGIKQRGVETKSLLKEVTAKLVPREAVFRRKMGFGVPIASWLATSMYQFAQSVLLSDKAARRGILVISQVRRLLDDHANRVQDHSSRLWALLMLELWFEAFVD